jgi:hypothetical protein
VKVVTLAWGLERRELKLSVENYVKQASLLPMLPWMESQTAVLKDLTPGLHPPPHTLKVKI